MPATSVAAAKGLRAGDLVRVVAINDNSVAHPSDWSSVAALLDEIAAGDRVAVSIQRGSEQEEALLTAAPMSAQELARRDRFLNENAGNEVVRWLQSLGRGETIEATVRREDSGRIRLESSMMSEWHMRGLEWLVNETAMGTSVPELDGNEPTPLLIGSVRGQIVFEPSSL